MDAKLARRLELLEEAIAEARNAIRRGDRGAVSFELGQAEAQLMLLRDELAPKIDMVQYAAQVCGMEVRP